MSKTKRHVPRQKTYTIHAADGCVMPLHPSIRVVGGVRPRVFTPETVITVEHSPAVVRRIMSGDFVIASDDAEHEDLILIEPETPVKTKRSKKKES
jgi:hypothetical protein